MARILEKVFSDLYSIISASGKNKNVKVQFGGDLRCEHFLAAFRRFLIIAQMFLTSGIRE